MKLLYFTAFLLTFTFTIASQTIEDNLYIKAIVQMDKGQFEDAATNFNQLIRLNYKNKETNMSLGNCYQEMGNYDKAIEIYTNALKLKNKFAFYKIAECYALTNNPNKAVDYLEEYLQTPNKLLESEIKLNNNFEHIEKSKNWVNLWKKEHYNNYEKKLSEAKFYISSEKYSEAFEILDNLLYKNENKYRAIDMRADLLILTGDYKNAAKEYSKASEIKSKNIDYKYKAANAYIKNQKYKKAVEYYNQIISTHPYLIKVCLKKSEAEIELNLPEKAKESINNFLIYYPENSKARQILGKIHALEGNYVSALEQYNICIEHDTSKNNYFYERADVFMELKLYEEATYDYSMALDLNPTNGEIYFKRALSNLKKFDYKNACIDFKRAQQLKYYKADDYIIKYCK